MGQLNLPQRLLQLPLLQRKKRKMMMTSISLVLMRMKRKMLKRPGLLERLKAYHERKAKKPALIAKTNVLFDVKPWDDETDMDEMLKACKSIEKEGLVWGASKLVPVGYGINKLQIMCVVEDEKVSIDELSEKMAEFEDFVQSVDVAAMSKI